MIFYCNSIVAAYISAVHHVNCQNIDVRTQAVTGSSFQIIVHYQENFAYLIHRRRIKTEEKAKVVASVWGEEFIQFPAALAVLPRMILNNMMNYTRMI